MRYTEEGQEGQEEEKSKKSSKRGGKKPGTPGDKVCIELILCFVIFFLNEL